MLEFKSIYIKELVCAAKLNMNVGNHDIPVTYTLRHFLLKYFLYLLQCG